MYIDPNTGGMLFQALAAIFAVVTGSLLVFSRQIRSGIARMRHFFRNMGHRASTKDENDEV